MSFHPCAVCLEDPTADGEGPVRTAWLGVTCWKCRPRVCAICRTSLDSETAEYHGGRWLCSRLCLRHWATDDLDPEPLYDDLGRRINYNEEAPERDEEGGA